MEKKLANESVKNNEIGNSLDKLISKRTAMQILKAFFFQSGYMRIPVKQRLKEKYIQV